MRHPWSHLGRPSATPAQRTLSDLEPCTPVRPWKSTSPAHLVLIHHVGLSDPTISEFDPCSLKEPAQLLRPIKFHKRGNIHFKEFTVNAKVTHLKKRRIRSEIDQAMTGHGLRWSQVPRAAEERGIALPGKKRAVHEQQSQRARIRAHELFI